MPFCYQYDNVEQIYLSSFLRNEPQGAINLINNIIMVLNTMGEGQIETSNRLHKTKILTRVFCSTQNNIVRVIKGVFTSFIFLLLVDAIHIFPSSFFIVQDRACVLSFLRFYSESYFYAYLFFIIANITLHLVPYSGSIMHFLRILLYSL